MSLDQPPLPPLVMFHFAVFLLFSQLTEPEIEFLNVWIIHQFVSRLIMLPYKHEPRQ